MANTTGNATVLLVEDTLSLARAYMEYMADEPWKVVHHETGGGALDFLAETVPEVILLDLVLPDMNGIEILKQVSALRMPCAVIVITAHGSINTAVEAMQAGAFDFVVKPFNADRLLVTVRNALERQHLSRLVETYREDFERTRFHGFLGGSLAMQGVYRIIESAGPSKATVFITGESGTGKEVCAEAIHQQSPRRGQPFIALNCGAIPKDLMESEIFGHVKGAFTGAHSDRDGAAHQANGGTLFLDEICEMDLDLQTKLLRFVQTGTFQKVGGNRTEAVDVRFVCATNRDPLAEVEAGRFREDLYYRLHVIPIHLPPLRDRDDDVLEIGRQFLVEFAREENKAFERLSPETESMFLSYDWPGNVRQLQNVIRNTVVLHEGREVMPAMLPAPLDRLVRESAPAAPAAEASAELAGGRGEGGLPRTVAEIRPLWRVEKEAIENAIGLCGNNIPKAAALLEISASTIYRKRQAWEHGKS